MTDVNNQATDSTETSFWRKLRAKFSREPFDYEKWWDRKREDYREAWNTHSDKDWAITKAQTELKRRDGNLKATSARTALLLTFAGLLLAAYGLAFQTRGISQISLLLAKAGVGLTAGALLITLHCIPPMWHAWRGRLMPAATHSKLMRYRFDEYAMTLLQTDRISTPLDRLKRRHLLAVVLLMPAVVTAVAAYFLQ